MRLSSYFLGILLAAIQFKPMQASQGTSSTQGQPTKRYVVLDTTSDSPSWTAVLMAMEASANPTNDFTLLGVLATESEQLDTFNVLMDSTGMSDCLTLVSSEESELYPVDGYDLESAPATVKQLVEWVNAYPHQVTIYASSSLATLVYAEAVDPSLAEKVAELLIVANLDDSDDFKVSGRVGFYENTPFIKDQDAFLAAMSGAIPLYRIMGPLQPVLSGPEIAKRVQDIVTKDAPSSEDADAMLRARPFTWSYLMGHFGRMLAGHKQAILMQEPGMAILVNPALATGETDVEFTFEQDEEGGQQAPVLALRKLEDPEITPGDRATVIHDIDSDKFWNLLVHTRSRDWKDFCAMSGLKKDAFRATVAGEDSTNQAHDEL